MERRNCYFLIVVLISLILAQSISLYIVSNAVVGNDLVWETLSRGNRNSYIAWQICEIFRSTAFQIAVLAFLGGTIQVGFIILNRVWSKSNPEK
jgi:hypothetical protein